MARAVNGGDPPSHVPSYQRTLKRFLSDLTGAQNLSAKTAKEYRNHLSALSADLAHVLECTVEEVPLQVKRSELSEAVSNWKLSQDRRYSSNSSATLPEERSPFTVRRRLTCIKKFYEWCVQEDLLESSPAVSLKLPSAPVNPPMAVDPTAAERVLSAARSGRVPERDTLLVALHLTCGLALREVSELSVHSVHGDPPTTLSVSGRNGRREVALSSLAREALREYLPARESLLLLHGASSDRLLLSWRPRVVGTNPDGTSRVRMEPSRESLGEALGRVLDRAGLEERNLGSQALRVAFAQTALASGSHSVFALQAQLGHATLMPLRNWVQTPESELTSSIVEHPLGKLSLPGRE